MWKLPINGEGNIPLPMYLCIKKLKNIMHANIPHFLWAIPVLKKKCSSSSPFPASGRQLLSGIINSAAQIIIRRKDGEEEDGRRRAEGTATTCRSVGGRWNEKMRRAEIPFALRRAELSLPSTRLMSVQGRFFFQDF